jgi:hypothetical protein
VRRTRRRCKRPRIRKADETRALAVSNENRKKKKKKKKNPFFSLSPCEFGIFGFDVIFVFPFIIYLRIENFENATNHQIWNARDRGSRLRSRPRRASLNVHVNFFFCALKTSTTVF